MNNALANFSDQIAAVVEQAAASVVQVHGHRRPAAGVVFADNLILTAAAADDDRVTVRVGEGQALDGAVLGRAANTGLTVVRVEGLGRPALTPAAEPKPGHLGIAIGRTWSGGVMATLSPVSVVGGPLRTGRASSLDRVIRIQQPPHGALTGGALVDASGHALGVITSYEIRGTTVVIPATLAWAAAARASTEGGTRQGFLGVSSLAVSLPERQRAGRAQADGLLVTNIAANSPADAGGLLIGDVIVAFDGEMVQEPEELVIRLRGDRVGKAVPLTVIRGAAVLDVTVTVGERPRR
ncbi:MAG: S1C family serine protease [Vicinamibacterales bacterium]